MHEEIMVTVNARVDVGIAPLIASLSRARAITVESCQGTDDPENKVDAFVSFRLTNWENTATFLFAKLLPYLNNDLRGQVALRITAYGTGEPLGVISMDPHPT
jgi:hypothetical protein